MARNLSPKTIIPSNLYVERDADRQLNHIVTDMGRPGYVLVARQMGKTNLLLNMKRNRENVGDIVPYFDLTTKFSSAQDLFRHIIDTLLERCDLGAQAQLGERFQVDRTTRKIEPTIEYDRHMRMILRSLGDKKVIITLDEVDSLIGTSYSNTFFAQIRSMYFSRSNYNEYERLTYTLSGVAEPSDLIRDKTISPFNIGEKLYLDDFTFAEATSLAVKASLGLKSEVVEHVYAWVSGNPRMTWDVYTEIEDIIDRGGIISTSMVDDIVQKLYLTRFDKTPVDHVRTLASEDPQIRNAISTIRWRQTETLDETTLSKLYLAGIVNATNGSNVKLKNRVISAALSDSWLSQISAQRKGLLEAASDHFSARRFELTLTLIQDYLQQPNAPELRFSSQFQFGTSKYQTQDYDGAVTELFKAHELASDDARKSSCQYLIGLCYFSLKNYREAIEPLSSAIELAPSGAMLARLALQATYANLGGDEALGRIAIIHDEFMAMSQILPETKEASAMMEDLVCGSLFNLSQINRQMGRYDEADRFLASALEQAPIRFRPSLISIIVKFEADASSKKTSAENAVDLVVNNRMTVQLQDADSLEFTENVLGQTFVNALNFATRAHFDNLMNHAIEVIYAHTRRPFDILLHVSKVSELDGDGMLTLLREACNKFRDASTQLDHKREAYVMLVRLGDDPSDIDFKADFLNATEQRFKRGISLSDDEVAAIFHITNNVEGRAAGMAFRAIDLGMAVFEQEGRDSPALKILFIRNAMLIHHRLDQPEKSKEYARRIVSLSEAMSGRTVEYFGVDLSLFINDAKRMALSLLPSKRSKSEHKYARNEYVIIRNVKSGASSKVKFKTVMKEVASGEVVILSNLFPTLAQSLGPFPPLEPLGRNENLRLALSSLRQKQGQNQSLPGRGINGFGINL